jgi:ribosomal protein S18 acetylase RimI-like enzyme
MSGRRIGFRPHSGAAGTAVAAAPAIGVGHAGLNVRRLGAGDLPAIARHLVELSPADRVARFPCKCDDNVSAARAGKVDPSAAILVGAFDASDRIVGLAEAQPGEVPHTVEMAVSIDPAFRRRGLARRLAARTLALAFARGARSATFSFAHHDLAVVRLVQALGGEISRPGHAVIDCAPREAASSQSDKTRHAHRRGRAQAQRR